MTLPDETDHIELTPRHYVNLRRVLDEALTNALKHGQPGTLRFGLAVEDAGVRLRLSNDIAGCGEANHDPPATASATCGPAWKNSTAN